MLTVVVLYSSSVAQRTIVIKGNGSPSGTINRNTYWDSGVTGDENNAFVTSKFIGHFNGATQPNRTFIFLEKWLTFSDSLGSDSQFIDVWLGLNMRALTSPGGDNTLHGFTILLLNKQFVADSIQPTDDTLGSSWTNQIGGTVATPWTVAGARGNGTDLIDSTNYFSSKFKIGWAGTEQDTVHSGDITTSDTLYIKIDTSYFNQVFRGDISDNGFRMENDSTIAGQSNNLGSIRFWTGASTNSQLILTADEIPSAIHKVVKLGRINLGKAKVQ